MGLLGKPTILGNPYISTSSSLYTKPVVYVFFLTSLGSMGSNPERKSVAVLVLVSQNLGNFSPEWQPCYIPTNETSKTYLTHYTTLFADMVKLDLSVMTHRDLYITCPLVIFMKDQPI